MKPEVIWMVRRHMSQVQTIEAVAFPYPWSEENFIRCLRQRNCIGMVAEDRGRVLGYMIYEIHRDRIHVLNFAVNPSYQRFGVGTAMVEKLKSKLNPQRRRKILLEIREGNLGAQLFFREQGFKATKLLRDFYVDSDEDAYLMQFVCQQPVECCGR
jgi:ribosomal-protein-alanine N-acetyltransferase